MGSPQGLAIVRQKGRGGRPGKAIASASWFIDDHLVPEREDLFAYYAGQDERQRLSGFATTASKESETLVHFMLAIGVAQSTQDAHGLVAGPDRPAWASPLRKRAPLRTAWT
jgi:hypothetical protein